MISNSLIHVIENGGDGFRFPLTDAYKRGHRFYADFVEMLDFFKDRLKANGYKDIEKRF